MYSNTPTFYEDIFMSIRMKVFFLFVLFFFFLLCCTAWMISVPRPGIEPGPQQWRSRILTTGNSLKVFLVYIIYESNICTVHLWLFWSFFCSYEVLLWMGFKRYRLLWWSCYYVVLDVYMYKMSFFSPQ